MVVKIINKSQNPLPTYATELSAGMDLRADLPQAVVLRPMERRLIPTGLYVELPEGYEMALRQGIGLVNSPGTIDADYRGEIGVIVINYGSDDVTIAPGDRICQAVVCKYTRVEWQSADSLGETSRGEGGFGHTGL